MKRVITAVILFVLLSVFCFWAYFFVSGISNEISATVQTSEQRVTADDFSGARDAMEDSYHTWSRHKNVLGTLTRHNEIDDIEMLYQRARQSLDNEDKNEALLQTRELKAMLSHLPEMQAPTYQNIF